jgi:hypothetical protein
MVLDKGPSRLGQQIRLVLGLRMFLSARLTLDAAQTQLRRRIERRDERFLEMLGHLVYERPRSPYAALLRWAGCDPGDVEASVRAHGVDATLERLREAGVHLSLDEFKSRTPIVRPGLTLETSPRDFDNPIFLGRALSGATSGTSGTGSRVFLDWSGLAEEAANELVLYATHGLHRAPLALWLPPPPGLAGIRNVLVNAKFGRSPQRWFSPTPWSSLRHRLATHGLVAGCRLFGTPAPRVEVVDPDDAWAVAAWLAEGRARGEARILSAVTSAAVRVAGAAAERGLDLEGSVVFATGEPLTLRRRRYIESSGLRAFARYVTAETGMVAGGCGRGPEPDGMHLYLDRVAAVPGLDRGAFLLTTLSRGTPKVMVNVDLGDRFALERRACRCAFGDIGMDHHVSGVHASERMTTEGGAVLVSELVEIAGMLVERAGAGPDDVQLAELQDRRGLASVQLIVSPTVPIDEPALVHEVLAELSKRGPAQRTMAELWRQSGTLSVVRAAPRPTSGAKLPAVLAPNAE